VPTWSEILSELAADQRPEKYDLARRKYLHALHQHTGRNIILYASKWTQAGTSLPPSLTTIVDEDVQGLMEVMHGLAGPDLDLIVHSPGGSPTATESIVSYIRSKFSHVRVIVPHLAMSAATMLACSADEIVLGKHSFLGPVDPQLILGTKLGMRSVPAQAILDQFDIARRECQIPTRLPAWLPMLEQYGPDLLVESQNSIELSKELVANWLEAYMFKGDPKGKRKARAIGKHLGSHQEFKSHGRHIDRETLREWGIIVKNLEDDPALQDLVLSVFHATTQTFDGTGTVKIVENHKGKAFVRAIQTFSVRMPALPQPTQPPHTN
jgi:hypothetical protein